MPTNNPPLPVGDVLADHFPTGLRSQRMVLKATSEVFESPVVCDCHCGESFSGTDEQEVRQLWAEHVTTLRTRSPDKLVGEVVVTQDGGEQAAWDWLDQMVSGICDEHPSDIAYSSDQMVDAFIAGARLAPRIAATDELVAEYRRAIEHLRSWIELHPMDATTETHAILHCSIALLNRTGGDQCRLTL